MKMNNEIDWTPTVQKDITTDGVKAYEVSTQATAANGVILKITAAISESQVRDSLRNRALNPNCVKFSVELFNLVPHYNNTKYAIVASLEAKSATLASQVTKKDTTDSPVDTTAAAGEGEVAVGTGGGFTWVKSATANFTNNVVNSNVPIVVSTVSVDDSGWLGRINKQASDFGQDDDDFDVSEDARIVVYTFNTNVGASPTYLFWDPNAQIADSTLASSSTSSSSTTSVSSLLVAFLLFFTLFL